MRLCISPKARLPGAADLELHVFEPATWYAWLYAALWVNKALFCIRFGGALPAVFGPSETGMFGVNPAWYLFLRAAPRVQAMAAVA